MRQQSLRQITSSDVIRFTTPFFLLVPHGMIWPVPPIHFFIAMLQLIRMNSKHSFFAFLAYSFLHPCFAEEVDVLPPEKWPVTVNATVSDIISQLSEEDKKVIGIHQGKT